MTRIGTLPPLNPLSAEALAGWNEWVATRPDVVRNVCERFPPWVYYDLPETGQTVIIEAYAEDGTVRVLVVADRISAPAVIQFGVFGIDPEDLVVHHAVAPH